MTTRKDGHIWNVGREVYCTGLLNRRRATVRGFKSLTFRQCSVDTEKAAEWFCRESEARIVTANVRVRFPDVHGSNIFPILSRNSRMGFRKS